MPGQFVDAPKFQLTLNHWENFSDFLVEIRKLAVFKGGVVKFLLPPEIVCQLEKSVTTFEDESPTSFFSTFGELPMSRYITQKVNVLNDKECVFSIDHASIPARDSGVKTVKEFYTLAKRNRPFGFYDGSEEPLDGKFDKATVQRLYKSFWEICQSGRTAEDPFLYGVDICKLPTERLGPFECLPLLKVF